MLENTCSKRNKCVVWFFSWQLVSPVALFPSIFFFNTLGTTISSGTLVSICHSFLSLTAKFQTRFNLFVSLFCFRRPLLISYKLGLGICLIVPDIFQKFSQFLQKTEVAFERCSTRVVFQQNDMQIYMQIW